MGKKRLLGVRERKGESGPKFVKDGKPIDEKEAAKGIWSKFKDALEDNYENNMARAKMKYFNRWKELSGREDGSIDMDNPVVRLEWFLCDFKITAKLTAGQREEVLALMPDDDMRR